MPTDQDILDAFHAPVSDDDILNAYHGQTPSITQALTQKLSNAGHSIVNGAEAIGQDALDTGRGVTQGVTLGSAPMIAAAGEATYDKLRDLITNNPDAKSWLQNYRQHQQESQANFDSAHERSPYLYDAGELGGMLGLGLGTGGLGDAAGLSEAVEQGGGAAAKYLGQSALKGAGLGAVQGAISSKGTLSDAEGNFNPQGAEEMGADALGGAAMGSVLNPMIEGAGYVGSDILKGLGDKLNSLSENKIAESPLLQQMKEGYIEGRNGIGLNNSTPSMTMQGDVQKDAVNYFGNNIINGQKILGGDISNALDAAKKVKVDIKPDVSDALTLIAGRLKGGAIGDIEAGQNAKEVLSNLAFGKNAVFTPTGLRTQLNVIQKMIEKAEDPALKEVLINLKDNAENKLVAAVPGLDVLRQRYNQFMSGVPEQLINGYKNSWLSDSPDAQSKLSEGLKGVLQKLQSTGSQSPEINSRLSATVENLRQMEADHPGILNRLGIDPDTFEDEMRQAGNQFEMSRAILGTSDPNHNPMSSWWTLLGGANTGRGQLINKANLAGRIVTAADESPVANMGRALYSLPAEQLSNVVGKLKQSQSTQGLGEYLEKAIVNKNDGAKNAALFSILQNPKARLIISGEDVE